MSDTAPMVQKCVRCAIAPKATASANAAHNTVAVNPGRSDSCIRSDDCNAVEAPHSRKCVAIKQPPRNRLCRAARGAPLGGSAAGAARGGHFSAASRSLPATAASDLG
jgi:hypothetical protein